MKENNNKQTTFFQAIIALALIAVVALLAIRTPTVNVKPDFNSPTDFQARQNSISVSGVYKSEVAPDEAKIRIAINTDGATAKEASENNAKITNQVIAALKRAGVDSDNIETDSFYLNEKREWNEITRKYEKKGYEQRHTLKVTTNDLDKVGNLLDIAIANGANSIQGVEYALSKSKTADVRKEILKMAAKNAEDKAAVLAEALDKEVVDTLTISENNYNIRPYTNYAYAEKAMYAADSGFNSGNELSPEKVDVSASVQVTFKIE